MVHAREQDVRVVRMHDDLGAAGDAIVGEAVRQLGPGLTAVGGLEQAPAPGVPPQVADGRGVDSIRVRWMDGDLGDLVLDGGETSTKVASTVLDLATSPPQIRRHGGISVDLLAPYFRELKK